MSEFDSVATRYDAELQHGLKWSGESPDYFVQGRVSHLARRARHDAWTTDTVLDFGCGTGNAMGPLLDKLQSRTVWGLDPSVESLRVAAQRHPQGMFQWTPTGDELVAESIDMVYSSGVFHHIPPSERQAVLGRIWKWLRPGGKMALFENNPWNPGTRWVMSRIPFDRDAICLPPPETRRRLQAAGFHVLGTDFLFFFPRLLAPLRRCELALRAVPVGAQYVVWAEKPIASGSGSHPTAPSV